MSTIDEQRKIILQTCRVYLSLPNIPIQQLQAQSSGKRATPAKGGIAIDQATFPAPPEADLRDALFEVIEELKSPEHDFMPSTELSQVDTGVEFVRDEANGSKVDTVILYMHGGGL